MGFWMSIDVPEQRSDVAHFRHGNLPSAPRSLSSTTRLAAAATYVDDAFADDVIDELITNEHRAVVPSFYGLDLNPVMRHALNAKRLQAYRDVVLTAILIVGLVVARASTICWLIVGAYVTVVARMWPALKPLARLVSVLIGAVIAAVLLGVFAIGYSLFSQQSSFETTSAAPISTTRLVVNLLLYPVAALLALMAFGWHRYSLLADGFRLGSTHALPEIRDRRIRRRVEDVVRAQYGNVTTYAGWSPFLGAGKVVRSWSIAVDLVSVDDITNARTPISIDPVDLHSAILERVSGLHDADQPDNERVAGLTIGHHIVARGSRKREHALIDGAGRPYSFAEPATIKAIIRHPQGGVRYYQRVNVTADGKPVLDRFGQEITETEDQEVASTAFIYLAVEGGMLYVEFVGTTMSPIREEYHAIDALPGRIQLEWLPRIFRIAAASFLPNAVLAPLRLIPGVFANALLHRRMKQATRDANEFLIYDYGARLSVRERLAAPSFTTYLQQLDAQKYSKFVERRMNEAVLDYLTAAGVDASEYRERVRVVQNTGVIITGGTVSGQVVNASSATTMSQTPTPEKAAS